MSEWKQLGADQWQFTGETTTHKDGLETTFTATVQWIERRYRESKNFRFEAIIGDKSFYFRTLAGAKRFVENYAIQKGKLN